MVTHSKTFKLLEKQKEIQRRKIAGDFMGFMQRDIDFKLILLILVVIIAIVGLTLFYQSSAGNIISKYNKVKDRLEETNENLTITVAKLDACAAKTENLTVELDTALSYQLESQDEFNELYTETQSSLEETESSLQNTEEELEDTEADLAAAESSLTTCEATVDTNREAADNANEYAGSAQSRLDSCKSCADTATCQTCINSALGDVNQVINYLDEIQG